MRRQIIFAAMLSTLCAAQVTIPEGIKLRVRLDQTISSATADEGQSVELSVTEAVKVGDVVAIAEGARVMGTITEAIAKRRMGRAGKLDFSIDKVRAVDGEWVPLRYTLNKKLGGSHAVRTGIITAGVAVAFWPAAPFMLLMKGKDVTINKGMAFDVFTDGDRTLTQKAGSPAGVSATQVATAPAAIPATPAPTPDANSSATGGTASVTIVASVAGADIEVDGVFVGSTPTTIQLKPGPHVITVKSEEKIWSRNLQVSAGSSVTLSATFAKTAGGSPKD